MAVRNPNPAIQHFDKSTSAPLSGGQMFFFEVDTVTEKDTFTDEDEGTSNSNPVILDSNGLEPDIFGNGSYRVVLRASPISPATVGVQQWDRDPVQFTSESGTGFEDWDENVNYIIRDLVRGSDLNFYVAIAASADQDPTLTGGDEFWTQFDLLNRWNELEIYAIDAVVRGSNGIVYTAVQSNINVDPINNISGDSWKMFDNVRIDGNLISVTATNQDLSLSSNGTGDINLVTESDLNVTATEDINLNLTGDLLSNGEFISLSEITQQIFTAGVDQTWTRPSNVKFINIDAIGGGGGAGSSSIAPNTAGQGGGAGGRAVFIVDVTDTSSLSLNVGSGGAGGAVDDNNGTNATGGIISGFSGGGTITIGGGLGGQHGSNTVDVDNGGTTSVVGLTGVQEYIGNSGAAGIAIPTVDSPASVTGKAFGGMGGASIYGGAVASEPSSAGTDARSPGTGGTGGGQHLSTAVSGGDGADGIIIITEYR